MSLNTNKDMNEYIKQRQGRAIAFFENQLELGDPKSLVLNRPRKGRSQTDRLAIVSGRTTQLSLTRMLELAELDPAAFRIIQNPITYPQISSSSEGSVSVAEPTFLTLSLNNAGAFEIFIVKYNTSGQLLWRSRISGTSSELGYAVASDSNGNLYVTGTSSSSTFKIYNKDDSEFSTITNLGSGDTFLIKYNSSGFVQWVCRIAGVADEVAYTLNIDSNDNIYVGGYQSSSPIRFFNSDNSEFTNYNTSAVYDVFLAKYSTSGFVSWIATIRGSSNEYAREIEFDSAGNIYLSGLFSSSVTIGVYSKENVFFKNITNSTSANALYIVKYNSSGIAQWATKIEGTVGVDSYALKINTSNVLYVILHSQNAITAFSENTGSITVSNSSGALKPILVKYNTSGVVQNGYLLFTGGGGDAASSLSLDSSNNLYIVAYFRSTSITIKNENATDFGTINNTKTDGTYESILIKCNSSGIVQWAARITGGTNELAYASAIDSLDNIYVIGTVDSTILTAFNKDSTQYSKTLTLTGTSDIFLIKYNSDGMVQWLAKITGSGNEQVNVTNAICVDSAGNVFSTGHYNSSTLTLYSEGQ